ncbi:MAG: hypothetical protein AAB373_01705 [Patescibacteria group bacterium]
MEKFTYKMGVITREVDISKEMITYKNQAIPSSQITGIGVVIMGNKNTLLARGVGVGVGGLVGGLIAGGIAGAMEKKEEVKEHPELLKELNLPPNSLGRVVVAYQEGSTAKKKSIEIPINTSLPECQNMIASLKNAFSGKFVGVDGPGTMYKTLGVMNKELAMAGWVIGGFFLFVILIMIFTN